MDVDSSVLGGGLCRGLPLLLGCDAPPAAPPAAPSAALARRIGIDVADEPLGEVLARLLDDAEIRLLNRYERRWPQNYRRDALVTLRLTDVRLESALRWLLLPRALDYVVEDVDFADGGPAIGLRIVGRDDGTEFVVRTYPVADIVSLDGGWCNEEMLADAILSLVAPGAWPPPNGPGCLQVMPGALTISGPPDVHRRVARLLDDIRRVGGAQQRGLALPPELPPASETERRLAAALERTVDLELVDATIEDFAGWLRGQGLNVVVDENAVRRWDVGRPVRLHGVPLARALDLLLADVLCAWGIKDEALSIYLDVYDFQIETRAYPIRHLMYTDEWMNGAVATRKGIRTTWFDGEDLIAAIKDVVSDEGWWNVDTDRGLAVEVPGSVAISQSPEVHRRVRRFLDCLGESFDPYRTVEPASSASYLHLEDALDRPVDLAWDEQPLQEALRQWLEGDCNLPAVLLCDSAFYDGVRPQEKQAFAIRVRGISLRAALALVLEPHGLTFQNVDGVLVVNEAADPELDYCFYRIPDDAVVEAVGILEGHVDPHSWSTTGGPAQLADFPGGLAVAATPEIHAEIRSLLARAGFLPRNLEEETSSEPEHVRRIRAALAEPVTLEVRDRPLEEFLAQLAAEHGIQAVFDGGTMSDGGTMPDVRLTGTFAGVPLGDALRRMLAPHKLDWVVRHEVLLIVEASRAAWLLTTRVYPYAGQPAIGGQMLTRFVGPESWGEAAGVCTELPHALIVTQTDSLHADAERLLDALRPPPGDDAEAVAERVRVASLERAIFDRSVVARPMAAALVDPSPRMRLLGLYVLREFGPLEGEADYAGIGKALLASLRAPERVVRLAAVSTLRWRNAGLDDAAPVLIELYREEPDPHQREAILQALAALGPAAALAWTELWDDDVPTAERALAQLKHLGPGAAAAVPEVIAFLWRRGEYFHVPVCEVFAAVGPGAEAAVPELVELIESDALRRDTVKAACRALGSIGAWPELAVPALIAVAEGDDYRDSPYVRAEAYQALSAFPTRAETIVPVLTRGLADPHKTVSNAAAGSLAPIQLIGGLSEPEDE